MIPEIKLIAEGRAAAGVTQTADRTHYTVVRSYMCLYYFLRGMCTHNTYAHATPQKCMHFLFWHF